MSVWLQIVLPGLIEIGLLSGTLYCVYRAQKSRIYPAFCHLLIFWLASDVIMVGDLALNGFQLLNRVHAYYIYFYVYWPSFAINAILMLRVLHEMFRHAVRSIPGVQQLGRPIFFWAIVVSVILASAAGTAPHVSGVALAVTVAQVLARSQAVLALCMLSFLAFASNALGVSFRSRIFGVIFGFGLMATANLVNAAILPHTSLASSANIIFETVNFAAMGVWITYFLRPEPVRRLVAMPVTSPLMRWNDVAHTLGNPSGQVAVSYPPTFMRDVFDLVNNVMGPANWPVEATSSESRPGPVAS